MGNPVIRSSFTGLTAGISFGPIEVGRLQDFAFTENDNMVPVRAIGSAANVALVPAVKEYQITASRAFMFGDLAMSMMGTFNINATNAGNNPAADAVTIDPTDKDAKTSTLGTLTLDQLKTVFSGANARLIEGTKSAQVYFDINVKNSQGDLLYTFEECLLTSRNTRISSTGIVILENVSLVSLRRRFGSAWEVTDAIPTT